VGVKHALITGGAGFIGSHLTETLLARDYHVTVLDDESTGTRENLAPVGDHFQLNYVRGSAADKSLVRRLIADVDEVYHLAAAVGLELIASAPIHTIETNIYPTELLLAEMLRRRKAGHVAKLFLASSAEVYGKNPKETWNEEDDLIFGPTSRPRWSSGTAKAMGELLALAYYRQHGLPIVIGRLFNVVGPRQSGRFGMVVPRLVEAALTGRPLIVHGDGGQVRSFIHVGDACRAILDLMASDGAVARVFNIGGDEPITLLELAQRVGAAARAGAAIELRPYPEMLGEQFEDVRRRVPDLGRLRATIGFRPQYDLDTTLREIINYTRVMLRKT
jgi:nucleoside-diphosphate-sugar epimerase